MPEPLSSLLSFAFFLVLLYWLQRWISQHVQGVGILLFDSSNAGMAMLWFLLLPGILIHELSHWAMAKLLGLKTGRFRVWPQIKGKDVILGSVEVQRSNPVKDSLVGLAPFLAGSLALLAIGYLVFDAGTLGEAWDRNAWNQVAQQVGGLLDVDDAWLWLYLIFAISNAMMPSASDRQSWRLVLFYLGLVTLVFLLFFGIPSLPTSTVEFITAGLRTLTYAFGLTVAIDLVVAVVIWLVEFILGTIRGRKIVYK